MLDAVEGLQTPESIAAPVDLEVSLRAYVAVRIITSDHLAARVSRSAGQS